MQFLESVDDLQWLHDVHGIDIRNVACAIIYGNEDWPDRVETFTINRYDAVPTVYGPAYFAGIHGR